MKYVVTAAQMKRADRETTAYFEVPELVLMENAARETARCIKELSHKKRVLVLAGCGNNGGDGMAAGRILHQQGCFVTVFLCAPKEQCTQSAAVQLRILEKYGVSVTDRFPEGEYDIIIDAVFGIGLSRPAAGRYADVLNWANKQPGLKAACDIPSGLDADTGQVRGCAFRADVTFCYGFLKRGLLLYPGADYAGKVVCLEIGITEQSFRGNLPEAFTFSDISETKELLPVRPAYSHKGSFGKVLLVAGSKNMSGACVLAAQSIYRAGAGLVRVMTPEENRVAVQSTVPEAVLRTWREEELPEEGMRLQLSEDIAWADCVVAGCGIGTAEPAAVLMEALLTSEAVREKKLLLDADALNLISANRQVSQAFDTLCGSGGRGLVAVTPHLLEFAGLTGDSVGNIQDNLPAKCSDFAVGHKVVTVCKDAGTVVGLPDGRIYLNQSGNSGMATAGSGDVLSGILGALAAQGLEWSQAAPLGVYLHGLAGDAAAEEMGEYAVMARDLPEMLQKVLR